MTISTPSQQVNHTGFGGSIMYNINAMSGFAMGKPTMSDGQLYSDVVWIDSSTKDYIAGEDPTVDVGGYIQGDDTTYKIIISREEWAEDNGFCLAKPGCLGLHLHQTKMTRHNMYVVTIISPKPSTTVPGQMCCSQH